MQGADFSQRPPAAGGEVYAVAVDGGFNTYITGTFSGTVDFDRTDGATDEFTAANSSFDAFITCYNADGSYAWTQTFGGDGDDAGFAIAVSGGTVYVAGNFGVGTFSNAGIGGGTETSNVNSGGDAFLIALDSSTGDANTAFSTDGIQTVGGFGPVSANGLAISASGEIYIVGLFEGQTDVDPNDTAAPSFDTHGGSDAFIVAFESDGDVLTSFGAGGAQTFGGSFDDTARAATILNNRIYVAGDFNSNDAAIGPDYGFAEAFDDLDAFVLSIDIATGQAVTAFSDDGVQIFGGSDREFGYAIAASGNRVYLGGEFASPDAGVDGPGTFANQSITMIKDGYVLVLNASSGQPSTPFNGTGFRRFDGDVRGLAVDGSNLYLGGTRESAETDATLRAVNRLSGQVDPFFGDQGVLRFGGTELDFGYGVAASGGEIYFVGTGASPDAALNRRGGVDLSVGGGFLLGVFDDGEPIFDFPAAAVNIVARTAEAVPVRIQLRATDPENGPYTFDITQMPTLGAITGFDDMTGELTYTPDPGTTLDTFNYTVTDDVGESSEAEVQIQVDSIAPDNDVAPAPAVRGAVRAVAVDDDGNRYIVGGFFGALDFDPTNGYDPRFSVGDNDAFITRINADGSYGWTQTLGTVGGDIASGIVVSGSDVFVTGIVDFDDDGISFSGVGPAFPPELNYSAVYVLGLDANSGERIDGFGIEGLQVFGNPDFGVGAFDVDQAYSPLPSIAEGFGRIYVAGSFFSENAGVGGAGAATSRDVDVFVMSLSIFTGEADSAFGVGGVQTFGGSLADYANAITVTPSDVYVVGSFESPDAGIGGLGLATSANASVDAFVFDLDSSTGAAQFFGQQGIQTFGGSDFDEARGVAVGQEGQVYVSGSFASTNAGIGRPGVISAESDSFDAFVLALDFTGGVFPGFGREGRGVQVVTGIFDEFGEGIALIDDRLFLAGSFESFNTGIGALGTVVATEDDFDGFIAAIDRFSGEPCADFGINGIATIGGREGGGGDVDYLEGPIALAVFDDQLYIAGNANSEKVAYLGKGGYDGTFLDGFVMPISPTNAQPLINYPVAAPDLSVIALEETPILIRLQASDPVGGPFTFAIVDPPFFGTLTDFDAVAGTVVYTPDPGFFDDFDSFTYTVDDGVALSAPGFVDIVVLDTDLTDAVAAGPIVQGIVGAVALDAAGNRYVAGAFSGLVDFNPGVGIDPRTAVDEFDAYVTRFNADGTYAWTVTLGTALSDRSAALLELNGTLYVTGTLAPDAPIFFNGVSTAQFDDAAAFVLALDAATGEPRLGFGQQGLQYILADDATGNALATDGTSIFVGGEYFGFIGIGRATVLPSDNYSAFVVSLDALTGAANTGFGRNGIQALNGGGDARANGIAVDGGRVYVSGTFETSASLAVNDSFTVGIEGEDGDVFVLCLDGMTGRAALDGAGPFALPISPKRFSGFGPAFIANGFVAASNGTVFLAATAGFPVLRTPDGVVIGTAESEGFEMYVAALDSDLRVESGFGIDGVRVLRGDFGGFAESIAAEGGRVFLGGSLSYVSTGDNAIVAAFDGVTGDLVRTFGERGILRAQSDGFATGARVAVNGSRMALGGIIDGSAIRANGRGAFLEIPEAFFDLFFPTAGFLLPANSSTGAPSVNLPADALPVSAATGIGRALTFRLNAYDSGGALTYQIVDPPKNGSISGLNAGTGALTYTPVAGFFGLDEFTYRVVDGTFTTGEATVSVSVLRDLQVAAPALASNGMTAVAVDGAGNRYIAGVFFQAQDFNPGLGVRAAAPAGPSGFADVYVTRINADGSYAWTQTFGGSGDDFSAAVTVAGNTVYVAGTFASPDAGIGGAGTLSAADAVILSQQIFADTDGFIVALNAATGDPVAGFGAGGVQTVGGIGEDSLTGVSVLNGTVYACGEFGTRDLGIGGLGFSTVFDVGLDGETVGVNTDALILAVDGASGAAVATFGISGVQTFGGVETDGAAAIAATSNRLFIAGFFTESAKFGGATKSKFGSGRVSAGGTDAFVLSVRPSDGDGFVIASFGGTLNERATAIASSGSGFVAAGVFQSSDIFSGAVSSRGADDAFVLSNSGDFQVFGGSGLDEPTGVTVSPDGQSVFVTGFFASSDAVLATRMGIRANGVLDAFILGLDANLRPRFSFGVGGVQTFGGSGGDGAVGVVLNPDGKTLLLAGSSFSNDAGVGGTGSLNIQGDYLVTLDRVADAIADPPVIQGSAVALAVDAAGNRYVAGSFNGSRDFNTAVGVSSLASRGGDDAFVSCLAPDGSLKWVQSFGGTGDDAGTGVAVSGGTVYACGRFSSTDAAVGAGSTFLAANGTDVFVIALNAADGAPVAGFGAAGAQKFGGADLSTVSGFDDAPSVAAAGGSVYVGGRFASTGAGIGGAGATASVGGFDGFVIALGGASGTPLLTFGTGGVVRIGGTGEEQVRRLVVSADTVYAVGSTNSTNLGIGGAGAARSLGGFDGFLAALSLQTGAAQLAFGGDGIETFGGAGTDVLVDAALSGTTLFAAGSTASANAGIGSAGSASSAGGDDACVVALNAVSAAPMAGFGSGGIQTFGGVNGDTASGIAASADGLTIYLVGFTSSGDGTVKGSTATVSAAGFVADDVFAAALNSTTGQAAAAFGIGGLRIFGGSLFETPGGAAISNGRLLVVGNSTSIDAGFGRVGTIDFRGFDGFLLDFDGNAGASDLVVRNTNNAGPNSLRNALANAGRGDRVVFDPLVFSLVNSDAATVINVDSELPPLSAGRVLVDASSRRVSVNGSAAGGAAGLVVTSDDNVIQGLTILNFSKAGVSIRNGKRNVIGGSRLLPADLASRGPNGQGLRIAGCGTFGVEITGAGAEGNTVIGCWLGLDASGVSANSNLAGILVQSSALNNTIGSANDGEENVISGNSFEGVTFSGNGTDGNTVLGSTIGVTAAAVSTATTSDASARAEIVGIIAGRGELGNGSAGIFISQGTKGTQISRRSQALPSAREQNVVGFNGGNGVEVRSAESQRNSALGNRITRNKKRGIALFDGSNGNISRPVITDVIGGRGSVPPQAGGAAPRLVSAQILGTSTAPDGSTIEVYNDAADQAGIILGRGSVSAGTFTVDVANLDPEMNVTATVTDGTGNTSEIAIFGGGGGTEGDADGDGVEDALETLVDSDPASPSDTPTKTAIISVDKFGLKLNFKKTLSDTLQITFQVTLPAGFTNAGATFVVQVGGFTKRLPLNDKGSGKDAVSTVKVSASKRAPTAGKVTFSVKKSDLSGVNALFNNRTTAKAGEPVTVPVNAGIIRTAGKAVFPGTVTATYKATQGKSGSAKK